MAKAHNNLRLEIIQPDEFQRFMAFMPNPDELLGDPGRSLPTYREMKLDGKIDSLLDLRKDTAVAYPWHLEQGRSSDQVYQFVKDNLSARLDWQADLRELLSAIDYGYAVSEALWAEQGGYWVPTKLKSRKPERFRFDSSGTLVLASTLQKLAMPYKFLIHRNKPEAENPYGTPVLSRCYWYWKFKYAGLEFWLNATEKFGVPSILALFDSSDERAAQKKAEELSQALTQVSSGSGAALANVKEVKALEITGSLADFAVLVHTCDAQMAYAITGQSLATQESEFGTRAQAEVHADTLDKICRGDASALGSLLQVLIGWMVEVNFGVGGPAPQGYFDIKSRASLQEVLSAVSVGVPVSKRLLYDRYGLPEPADDDDVFIKPAGPAPGDFGLQLSDSKKKPRFI